MSDRLIMLGVSGGPPIFKGSAKPAIALEVAGDFYLVDCGYQTPTQIVEAGLTFDNLRGIFITHNHLDHTSGLPGVFIHGWASPKRIKPGVPVFTPPPAKRIVEGLKVLFGDDIQNYEVGGGLGNMPYPAAFDLEVEKGVIAKVFEDDNISVSTVRIFHGSELEYAYAFRIDIKHSGKSVAFSGDVAANDQGLIELATGCDFLVHEIQDNENVEMFTSRLPDKKEGLELRKHLFDAHTSTADIASVALAANAKNLVFCHYTPIPQAPEIYLEKVKPFAEKIGYSGGIIAPKDLDVIEI